jgi:hypothetical protein
MLARSLRDLTGAFVRAGAGTGGIPPVPLWFGLLRVVDPAGVPAREVPALARLSKRTVRPALRAAQATGWVEGTATRVGLTTAGARARQAWAALVPEVEDAWSAAIGPAAASGLRRCAAAVVARFDLELPHYPVSYGAVDRSVTGGNARPGQAGPPRIPPHGDDWRPVVRGDGDTVSGLGVTALLSQLLVGFTIDCDAAGLGSLAVIEGLAAGFGDRQAVPLTELPRSLGITGSGRTGLERHGYVTVTPDPDRPRGKLATLTPRGARARDARGPLPQEVESAWADRYGGDEVAALRAALSAVDAGLDPALPGHLLVSL